MSKLKCRSIESWAHAGRTMIAMALACAAVLTVSVNAEPTPQDAQTISDRANRALGLLGSEYVQMNQDFQPGVPLLVEIPINGRSYTFDLDVHSVRSSGYRLLVSGPGGALTETAPGIVNTLRGVLREDPDSRVSAAVMDDGLHALIVFGSGQRYWLQPIVAQVPEAPIGSHVVYRDDDMIQNFGRCGVNDRGLDRNPGEFDPDGEVQNEGDGALLGGTLYTAELACDADFSYYQDYGSSVSQVEARINLVINNVNDQYEGQVDVTHLITTIIVRTSQVYTTNDAGTLLDQFRDRWLQFHGGIQRDVAHLFTGRNLNGGTIGIAYTIGGICTTAAYCLSESDCCGSLGCATDLTAHELGHLWGGFHCDPCNTTMRSFIGCFNNFIQATRNSIISHRNSRTCLDTHVFDYCTASSNSTSGDYINNFSLGTIDHNSGSSGYADFSSQFISDIEKGEAHPISVSIANGVSTGIGGLWIDWNDDFLFDGPGEEIDVDWTGSGPYTAVLLVPPTSSLGSKRVRVRVQDGASNPFLNPCTVSSTGEVEDYTIIVFDDVPPPANDNCDDATPVGVGNYSFDNLNATTDGPAHPFECADAGYMQYDSDVWYRYDAPCTGLVTVDLCDSDFNTKLAVYTEPCPDSAAAVEACNDDFCGTGSQLLFIGLEGESYYIRIGGFQGVQGSGMMVITNSCVEETGACCFADGTCNLLSDGDCGTAGGVYSGDGTGCTPNACPQPPDCPEDVDDDNLVGFQDLLIMLSAWGTDGAGADIAEPFNIVDFQDLLGLLSAWGPCL